MALWKMNKKQPQDSIHPRYLKPRMEAPLYCLGKIVGQQKIQNSNEQIDRKFDQLLACIREYECPIDYVNE